jgi:hypothetical protein
MGIRAGAYEYEYEYKLSSQLQSIHLNVEYILNYKVMHSIEQC